MLYEVITKIKDESNLKYFFDVVAEGDLEAILHDLAVNNFNPEKIDNKRLRTYEELDTFVKYGTKIA